MKWIIENRSRLEDHEAIEVAELIVKNYSLLPAADTQHIGVASLLWSEIRYDVVISKNKNSIRLVVLNEQEEKDDK